MRWAAHVFSLELRKALTYRVDFWTNFLLGTFVELALAYFVWKAVYEGSGSKMIGGYGFHGMMFYYLLVALLGRIVRGNEFGLLSAEIYDGSLTRYLVYPVSFMGYKYVSQLANAVVMLAQLALMMTALVVAFGVPPELRLSPASVAGGVLASLLAGALYFQLLSCLELVSFWQDHVWSLNVMLRMSSAFLGGAAAPLSVYPGWLRSIALATPFPSLFSFPIQMFLGKVSGAQALASFGALLGWIVAAAAVARLIWRRGTRQYTGVGL